MSANTSSRQESTDNSYGYDVGDIDNILHSDVLSATMRHSDVDPESLAAILRYHADRLDANGFEDYQP